MLSVPVLNSLYLLSFILVFARRPLLSHRWLVRRLPILILAASIPVLVYIYAPVWTELGRWPTPYHLARYRWLGQELRGAAGRVALDLRDR